MKICYAFCGLILLVGVSACQIPAGGGGFPAATTSLESGSTTGTQGALAESPGPPATQITGAEATASGAAGIPVLLAHTEKQILRSNDGGLTWQDITPAGLQGALVAAGDVYGGRLKADFSEDFGLAAISQTRQVLVYRTEDGGINWAESVVELAEEAQGIISVDVLGEQNGWVLVSRGVGAGNEWVDLYATQDSGASWSHDAWSSTEVDPFGRIPSGGLKSGITFSDLQTGWISGSAPIESIYLFRSLDGGQTWQEAPLPLPDEVAMPGTSSPPEFFSEDLGVIGVTVYTGDDTVGLLFFWTRDEGKSWQPSAVLEGNATAWDWLDELHGYVAEVNDAGQTRLHTTRDGGLSWEATPLELAYLHKIEFVSVQVGWAICGWQDAPWTGCAGDLYRTEDGGGSWEIVTP